MRRNCLLCLVLMAILTALPLLGVLAEEEPVNTPNPAALLSELTGGDHPALVPSAENPNLGADGLYLDPLKINPDNMQVESGPHILEAPLASDDPAYYRQLAFDADLLIRLLVECADQEDAFEGAPSAGLSWRIFTRYFLAHAEMGDSPLGFGLGMETEGVGSIPAEQITRLYDHLFAYGVTPSGPEDEQALLTRADAASYRLDFADTYQERKAYVNQVYGRTDGQLVVDVSVVESSNDGATKFLYNAYILLMPCSDSVFGAKIAGFWTNESSSLNNWDVITNNTLAGEEYGASNVMDGNALNCWGFSGGRGEISFELDEPAEVRGIMIMPRYNKNAGTIVSNNRVRTIRLSLSDGYSVEAELPDTIDGSGWFTLPLSELHSARWVKLEILSTYPGEQYDDTCVSEIVLF